MGANPILDNREIAILVWSAACLLWLSAVTWSEATVRKTAAQAIKATLNRKLVVLFLFVAAYAIGVVALLQRLGLWSMSNLKASTLWFFTAGLVMVGQVISKREKGRYLRQILWDGFRISVVLEFVINFYVMSLPMELILVPITSALTAMFVVSEGKEEYKQVHSLLSWVLAIIGLSLLGFSVHHAISEPELAFKAPTIAEFLFPIVLTTLSVPGLYLLATIVTYEGVFIRLPFFIRDEELCRFAKRRAIWTFGLNFQRLDAWFQYLLEHRPENRAEVIASMKKL